MKMYRESGNEGGSFPTKLLDDAVLSSLAQRAVSHTKICPFFHPQRLRSGPQVEATCMLRNRVTAVQTQPFFRRVRLARHSGSGNTQQSCSMSSSLFLHVSHRACCASCELPSNIQRGNMSPTGKLMTCFRSGFQDLLAHAKNTSSCMCVCVLAVQSVGDDTSASSLRGANSAGSKKTVFVSVDGQVDGTETFEHLLFPLFTFELDLVCVVFSYMLKPVCCFSRCLACGPVSRKLGEQHEFLEKVNLRVLVFFSHFALLVERMCRVRDMTQQQLAGSCNHFT